MGLRLSAKAGDLVNPRRATVLSTTPARGTFGVVTPRPVPEGSSLLGPPGGARVWAVNLAKRPASSPETAREGSGPCGCSWSCSNGMISMDQVRAKPSGNAHADGLITRAPVGGGSGKGHRRLAAFGPSTPIQPLRKEMTAAPRFSRLALEELARAKILGVRAGTE